MKIWIVQGTSGEYSDRCEWLVDAWPTEEAAQARVTELERLLQEFSINRMDRYSPAWEAAIAKFRKEHDPEFQHDYTGTRYYLSACEFHNQNFSETK